MAAIDVPAGNWLAGEIRRFQEKSTGLFPQHQPGDERTKYNSVYSIDYVPVGQEAYKAETPALLRRPGIKKEAPFQLEQAKRFNTWKINKNLVELDKVQQRVSERRKTALEQPQNDEHTLPRIERSNTVATFGRKSENKFGLKTPVLPMAPQVTNLEPQRAVRSHQESVRKTTPSVTRYADREDMKSVNKYLLNAADDYVRTSPQSDRRVIDKALRTSNAHYREDLKTINKPELVDPKTQAEKWLQEANAQEQEVAVRFFKSLGGMRLMGSQSKQAHSERLNELIQALESGEAKIPIPHMNYEDEMMRRQRKQRKLQFVRLLSPSTRNRRGELQTWHHLPDYRAINRTDNVSSHYTTPQKVKSLHFSIHPDWGMN